MPHHHTRLKTRQRALREGFSSDFGLRIHRAISWIGRAEQAVGDLDASFVFYWIAFNAAYAQDRDPVAERDAFRDFFTQLSRLDKEHRIHSEVWTAFSGPIRLFLENRYVFAPFWQHQNGIAGYDDWQARFTAAKTRFHTALGQRDAVLILSMLFDRLYVLRNQIVHGGATWNSSANRDQLRDGTRILGTLLPAIVDLMMDHPTEDWGRPWYPVISD